MSSTVLLKSYVVKKKDTTKKITNCQRQTFIKHRGKKFNYCKSEKEKDQ